MKLLAVTPGEPAGIGPEILLRHRLAHPDQPLVAVGDPQLLRSRAEYFKLPVAIEEWQPGDTLPTHALACLPVPLERTARLGTLDPANGRYVLNTLNRAVDLVLDQEAAGLVTGPIHKGVINDGGQPFTGHTEFLAERAGVDQGVMMLAADALRVALVTTHLPLSAVPAAITPAAVEGAVRICYADLRRRFGIKQPVLQVLGLNPHAGEGGHLGYEDDHIIAPVLERCRAEGMHLTGPVPADAAFTPRALDQCDAVLAMYHDQGLPVLKHAGFGRAINITLGLPFLRTSVDHGTALDIAAQGGADAASLGHAIAQAFALSAPTHET